MKNKAFTTMVQQLGSKKRKNTHPKRNAAGDDDDAETFGCWQFFFLNKSGFIYNFFIF